MSTTERARERHPSRGVIRKATATLTYKDTAHHVSIKERYGGRERSSRPEVTNVAAKQERWREMAEARLLPLARTPGYETAP